MVNVVTEIAIKRPIEEVASYASNPDKAPEWYINIKSAVWQTPRPLQVGTRVAFHAQFLGKQLSYIYDFVELIPQRKLVMRTAEGPFPMETTYTWASTPDGFTHMTLRNAGQPTGFSALFAPFMSMAMKRANRKDLQLLKKILETPENNNNANTSNN